MSSDFYGQGQGGKDQQVRQWILTRLNENDDHFQQSQSSMSGSPSWQEQGYMSQDSPLPYQDVNQQQDGLTQQNLQSKSSQSMRREDKMSLAYTHQAAFGIPQGHRSSPSASLDGQSLYCTEVLPSVSPPSQPITVEGGGTSRRGLLAVNGGAGSQPVQYTIIITDPQLQQASSSGSNNGGTSGATNILLNTLVQQQQQQQLQLQQQQQLQQHLATISKANNSISNLITGANNGNLLVNNNNVNGSSKLSSLLICNNNNNSNLASDTINNTSTFPANFITTNQNNSFSDGKSIHIAKVTLSANNRLPPVIDSGGIEGGFVILNYSDPQLRAGTTTINNINQLVSVHSKVPTSTDLVTQGKTHHIIKAVSDTSAANNTSSNRGVSSISKISFCEPDPIQVDFRTRGSVPYNGQTFLDKENSEDQGINENTISHISQPLPFSGEQQLIVSTSSSNRVSGGMHSGRTGSGSGQAHTSHSQQQRHSPVSSSSSSISSSTTSSQSTMLSAGQPAVPSGIFRTGSESTSGSQRLSASGGSSYIPAQYPSIYGIHSQAPGHLTNLQPYSTFFPGFGGSGTSGHTFSHGSIMSGTTQGHYPHIESYSAMLASMGSHVQHRGSQGADRTPRAQTPGVSVTQHASHFLSPTVHLTAPGVQYSSIPTSSHRRPSGSSSPSPGPAVTSHTPPSASAHLDPLSSHHLEKMAAIKGGSSLQSREVEVSREMRLHGDSSSLLEGKSSLSPSSTYSISSHIPKVSFDTVVKEYGGGRDSPSRGDLYFRTSLSGKEGSLKHRILTRPSDSDVMEDLSKVSGLHGLKDEPLAKRQKLTGVGSAAMVYGAQASHGHHGDSQRSGNRYLHVAHTSQHSQPITSSAMDSRGIGVRHHTDNNLPGHEPQLSSPYQHHLSEESSTDVRYQQPHYHPSPISTPVSLSPSSENLPSHLQYPSHFMKGSIIQLANGALKRVEDLQTEDFISSAEISSDLKVDSSTVVRIEEQPDRGTAMLSFSVGEHRVQVTVEATLEHPFFVFGQGWSSCSVSRTLARYGLDCQKLNVGDVCISLTHKDVNLKAAELGQQQHDQSYLADPHSKLAMTSSSATTEPHIPSPQLPVSTATLSTSSSASMSSTSFPSSVVPPTLKSESPDTSFLPPLPSSPSAGKRRLSQTELPPPLSNIVLVKKENNNGHSSRRRSSQRVEDEVRDEKMFEEDDESDSTLSLRKRRWSAPDTSSVKPDQDREKDVHIPSGAQKVEDTQHTSSSDKSLQ